jgi:hypothetical protein
VAASLAFAGAAVGIAGFARANESLRITGPSCGRAVGFAPAWEQLALELRAEGFSPVETSTRPASGAAGSADVEVLLHFETCSAHPRELDVLVRLGASDLWQHRAFSIFDQNLGGQPRLLALTVAEFVRSAFADLVAHRQKEGVVDDGTPNTAALPEPAAPSALSAPAVTASDFARVGIGVLFASRYFTSPPTGVSGAHAVGRLPISEHAVAHLELGAAWGSAEDALGTLHLVCPSAVLAFDVATPGNDLRLEVGPRVEVAYVRATVRPARGAAGQNANAAIVLAGVGAALLGRVVPGWLAWFSAEASETLVGLRLRADHRAPAAFVGPTIALRIGVARTL